MADDGKVHLQSSLENQEKPGLARVVADDDQLRPVITDRTDTVVTKLWFSVWMLEKPCEREGVRGFEVYIYMYTVYIYINPPHKSGVCFLPSTVGPAGQWIPG